MISGAGIMRVFYVCDACGWPHVVYAIPAGLQNVIILVSGCRLQSENRVLPYRA